MKGNLSNDEQKQNTIISLKVRPSGKVMFLVGFFDFLIILGFINGLAQKDHGFLVGGSLFIAISYIFLLGEFNKELKTYTGFIEDKVLGYAWFEEVKEDGK